MVFQFHTSAGPDEEMGLLLGTILGIALVLSLALRLALSVLRCAGLYTIAKRRGLRRAWLVWIPVAGKWILGSLSDQYRYLVRGQYQSRRKILLGLSIANSLLTLCTLSTALCCAGAVLPVWERLSASEAASALLAPSMVLAISGCILLALKVLEFIFKQLCMVDLYRSCDPVNAIAYLVFGILLRFLEPFFLLALRKRDNGLPPRREPIVE